MIKGRNPRINGICEQFDKTILSYQVALQAPGPLAFTALSSWALSGMAMVSAGCWVSGIRSSLNGITTTSAKRRWVGQVVRMLSVPILSSYRDADGFAIEICVIGQQQPQRVPDTPAQKENPQDASIGLPLT
jgi:hypothetical protein